MHERGSGILLSITSLPGRYGIGDLGNAAYEFADFLESARQRYWQILPLNPVDPIYGSSPYHSTSAFASNVYLISPDRMMEEGLLARDDIEPLPSFPRGTVDYHAVITYKNRLFRKAYGRFTPGGNKGYEQFCARHKKWLDDFSLFVTLKARCGSGVWSEWGAELRDRNATAMQAAVKQFADQIAYEKFLQYIFFTQWAELKRYCNKRGISFFGDMPIYVDYDSADVWTSPEMFKLDGAKRPTAVAGVPPDYFSETGQRWGNPLYQWGVMKQDGYDWWMRRVAHNLDLFDVVRIDHFRGFVGYWEIPADRQTAIEGAWVAAPAEDFFSVLTRRFPGAPIIAEDLGIITPDVKEMMDRFAFPGMKVLLFAFNDEKGTNPYLPHHHVENCVLYTGTHDNNTVRGWFANEASPEVKRNFFRYLGREPNEDTIHWELIRLAMMSVAKTVIIPLQDVLGLGEDARMNRPSVTDGNWKWRVSSDRLTPQVAAALADMTSLYGRAH
jgi:4-alpha-glucanotransferase